MSENEITVLEPEAGVSSVCVYLDRAMVSRKAEVELDSGKTKILFTELPAMIDSKSVQLSGKLKGQGDLTLRDVKIVERFLSKDNSAARRELEKLLTEQNDIIIKADDTISTAEAGKQFLLDMSKRLTTAPQEETNPPMDAKAWQDMLNLYNERHKELSERTRVAEKEREKAQNEQERIQRELKSLGQETQHSIIEAEALVEAKSKCKAVIEISYLVHGPSWQPDYIIRANSEDDSAELHYRAIVRQNTGEDWRNAAFSLSTAAAHHAGSMPTLPGWHLSFYSPVRSAPTTGVKLGMRAPAASPAPEEVEVTAAPKRSARPIRHTEAELSSSAVAVNFNIPGLSTVESDNKEKTLTVGLLELKAEYSWGAVPKQSPLVWFRAELKNETDFPLLPGISHVYVDGAFVADSNIDLVSPGESFFADLGVDNSIVIERKQIKKLRETTGPINKKQKHSYEWETVISNNKKRKVKLLLKDHYPVSTDEQILVRLLSPKPGKDNDSPRTTDPGILEWVLEIEQGQKETISLAYSVEYPQGSVIRGL